MKSLATGFLMALGITATAGIFTAFSAESAYAEDLSTARGEVSLGYFVKGDKTYNCINFATPLDPREPFELTSIDGTPLSELITFGSRGKVDAIRVGRNGNDWFIYDYAIQVDGNSDGNTYDLVFTDCSNDIYKLGIRLGRTVTHDLDYNSEKPGIRQVCWQRTYYPYSPAFSQYIPDDIPENAIIGWEASNDRKYIELDPSAYGIDYEKYTSITNINGIPLKDIIRFKDGGYVSKISFYTTEGAYTSINVFASGPDGFWDYGSLKFTDEEKEEYSLSIWRKAEDKHYVTYDKNVKIVRIEWE